MEAEAGAKQQSSPEPRSAGGPGPGARQRTHPQGLRRGRGPPAGAARPADPAGFLTSRTVSNKRVLS